MEDFLARGENENKYVIYHTIWKRMRVKYLMEEKLYTLVGD